MVRVVDEVVRPSSYKAEDGTRPASSVYEDTPIDIRGEPSVSYALEYAEELQGKDMTRVTAIYKPGDYPQPLDQATKQDLAELFNRLFPGAPTPEIDKSHAGLAIAAQNPKLALRLAELSGFIVRELPWCKRRDLWELAVQTVNVHFKSDYSFKVRMPSAAAAGISVDLQNDLPNWQTSRLFNDEQRLVVEYANAVMTGHVPDELFSRVTDRFGEKGAVEFTTVVGFWSFWAMFLNATGPDLLAQPYQA